MKEKQNRILSISASIIVLLLGILVIIGWLTHNDFLRSIVPGAVKMKFNVALNFILASIILLLYHFKKENKIQQLVSVLFCLIISLTGLLTLIEYIFGLNLGIDEFIVEDELPTTAIYYAGRMSPISALNFSQIGIGLLLMNREKSAIYQLFYLFEIAFVALLMLISFNFVTDIPTFFRLAIHVAIGFIALPVAIFFAQPMLQKKVNFEYLMLTGFIAVILLTLVISIYSFYYNTELVRSTRLVEHTNNVLNESEKILSLAKDIESGGRGYIITGDSVYLEHFTIAKNSIFSHVNTIRELTKDNPAQQVRIDSLPKEVNSRIDFSEKLVRIRNEKGFEAANQMLITLKGQRYTDSIRKLTFEIQQQENDLLVQRKKQNNESISAYNYAFRILLISLVVLLFSIFFVMRYNFMKRRKAEEQSKEREEQIQTIFRAAPDAVIAMDGDGRIVRWNPKAEVLFGWTEEEVIGRSLSDTVIPHRYRDAHRKGLLHFVRSGEGPVLNKTIEIQALNRKDIEFDISLSISPAIVKGQHLFIGFIQDITERKKIEDQLKKSNALFSSLFEHNPASMVISRLSDAKILRVNEAFLSSFKFSSSEEVLGKTARELNIVAQPEQREELTQLLKENKIVKDFEIKTYTRQGKVFWISTSILVIEIENTPCLFSSSIDISNRKNIEAQIQKQNQDIQAFIDSMSTLCAKVSTDGKILLVNKTALLGTGLSMEELLSTNFVEGGWWTFNVDVHSRMREAFKKACSGTVINYDENIFVFGQVLTVNFSLTPIFGLGGLVDYIVAEGRDISYLKVTEAKLLQQSNQLETVNKELEAFSYSVSHDLRAPLRAIHGYTKILSEDYINSLDDEAKEMMNSVLDNAKKMGQLIDDLLAFSKMGRKELQITTVDMTDIANVVLQDLKKSLPSLKATFTIHALLPAKTDKSLIRQVFFNLISNAIKYSDGNPHPKVEISSISEKEEIVYCVKDNGVGFDMKYSNKLFGVFQRLHSDAEFEGTGVGLALVKRIISKHGGKVWAEAELGKGATFYFSLNKNGFGST